MTAPIYWPRMNATVNLMLLKNDKVLLCNLQQVDYFGDAVLQPHIILSDLIKAFHPGILPEHTPVYFKKLE